MAIPYSFLCIMSFNSTSLVLDKFTLNSLISNELFKQTDANECSHLENGARSAMMYIVCAAALTSRFCFFASSDGPSRMMFVLGTHFDSLLHTTHSKLWQCMIWQKNNKKKKRSEVMKTLCAGCSKVEPKMFPPPQTPFPGVQEGPNLISWRWSLRSPTNPVWWRSMDAISSYRGNRPTHTHTPIIIIIRSRRQQRSVASTQSGRDDEPWTIQHECWRVYHRRSAGSMNGAGVLAVAANQDQSGDQFLLLRPVIMRGVDWRVVIEWPHGRTMNFVSWRWYPEQSAGLTAVNLSY